MGKGLDPGTGEIKVPEEGGRGNAKIWPTFWRNIDVAVGREWRGGDIEDFLVEDPWS